MQTFEREYRQQLICLYTKQKDKTEGSEQTSITLDLSEWRLLAYGGAYWVFNCHYKQPIQAHQQHLTNTSKYQNPGEFILRTRQLKYLKPIAKLRSKFILSSFVTSNDKITSEVQFKSELEKQNLKIGEMLCVGRDDQLGGIIDCVYGRFLGACVLQQQAMLVEVSKHIVRQSQLYYLNNPNLSSHQEQQTSTQVLQLIHSTHQFITFLLKQLVYLQVSTEIHSQSITGTCEKDIFNRIQEHFLKYPVNLNKVINSSDTNRLGKQLVVTFQRNLLDFCQCQTELLKRKSQKQGMLSYYNVIIGEVFEFKPKSILPDIYTESFLDQFVHRYQCDDHIKRFYQRSQQKMQEEECCDNLSRAKIKQKVIKEIQMSIIMQGNNNGGVNLCSTRWFKKNCLLKGKKKMNENPMVYFGGCIINNKHNNISISNQAINYYSKKHFRKLQLLEVNRNQQQNAQTNNKQLNSQQQLQKSLHENIIELINSKTVSDDNLSLIEEISALQLIDVIQQIEGDGSQRYMDAMRLSCVARELKSLTGRGILMGKDGRINDGVHGVSEEKTYPTKVMESIGKVYRPQVYKKATQLSQLLRQIVFQSKQVDSEVTKAFCINHQVNQSINYAKMQIKTKIFNLVRFLISLTWKDISILIQQTLNIFYQQQQSSQMSNQFVSMCQNFTQNKGNLNQISVDKYLIQQLLLKSSLSCNGYIQRKIVGCGIIDYGIKTVGNIERNVEKDCQFLKNYLCYKMGLQG